MQYSVKILINLLKPISAGLIFFCIYYLYNQNSHISTTRPETNATLTDLHIRAFDANGQLTSAAYAPHALKTQADNYIFTSPRLYTKSSNSADQAIFFQADSVDYSQETHHSKYLGNVMLDRGDTHLRANHAETFGDANNPVIQAIIYGSQTQQAHYWTTLTPEKPMLHAYADKLYYNHLTQSIKLVGNAKVIQGEHALHAPIIHYNIRTQHVRTEATPNTRTTIILHPKNIPNYTYANH